ncbi:MAG: hypothetical protein HY720_09600 [Planctomycetes bacterium]|nr:hypothetical protein [Planctomycetota bacterium]
MVLSPRRLATLWILAALSPLPAASPQETPGPEERRAFTDLALYYENEEKVPPYAKAIGDLGSEDAETRRAAGEYLRALLAQSLADETNGRAPWRSLPYWGGGSESPARKIREALAKAMAEGARGEEAIAAAAWLLEEEPLVEGRTAGAEALARIEGPGVAPVVRRVLTRDFLTEVAAVRLLALAGERSMGELSDVALALSNHYRTAVREEARKTAARLGAGPIPEFRPQEAFTPWLAREIERIAAMVLPAIPESARFVRVEVAEPSDVNEGFGERPWSAAAWILDESDAAIRFLDLFARESTIDRARCRKIEDWSLAKEAERLLAIRSGVADAREAADQLSLRGGLTGQFEPGFVSLPEALVAAWSFVRGDKKTAAAVLFPRIDEAADDRWIGSAARDLLGRHYHQEMLDAFAGARDYDRVLAFAGHLSRDLFDGYEYQGRARELAAQIEARRDDFRDFRLPTPEEWKELCSRLSREERIRYLAARLRLLNCFQWGQPGGVSYEDRQHAEPRSAGKEPETEVTNPFVELRSMGLTVADLVHLVPYLADENYMPTYSYWRNFHPSRDLHRVNGAVAYIVNEVARRDIANLGTYWSLDAEGRRRHVEAVLSWCRENASRTPRGLAIETLQASSTWSDFESAAREAAREKWAEALSTVAARLDDWKHREGDVAELAYGFHSPEALPHARSWQGHAEREVRFWASLVLLEHGDRAKLEGLETLRGALAKDDGSWLYPRAIVPLLATGQAEALELAAGILRKPQFQWDDSDLLLRVLLAGRREALDFALARLASHRDRGTSSTMRDGKLIEAHVMDGDRAAETIASWRTDGFEYDVFAPEDERADKRKDLASWLGEEFKRIEKGEKPDMRLPRDFVPPEWQVDAPK